MTPPVGTCKQGHPYTPENLRIVTIRGSQVRQCRACDKAKAQAKRDRLRGDKPKFKKDPSKLKEKCVRDHPLEGDNIRWVDTPWGRQKRCIACEKARRGGYRERFDAIAGGLSEPVAPSPRQKEFCKYGHAMVGDNIYINPDGSGRGCKACRLAAVKRNQAKDHDKYLEYKKELHRQEREFVNSSVVKAILRLRSEIPDRDTLLAEIGKVLKATAQ